MILDYDMDLRTIDGFLHGLTGALNDLRPVWQVIHEDFMQIEEVQFASEGERGGEKWADLSPRYAERKERKYPGNPILVASGAMAGSLLSKGSDHRFRRSPKEMQTGTGVPYAVFHQTGTRKMLKRPPIQITESDRGRWRDAVSEFINRYLRGRR